MNGGIEMTDYVIYPPAGTPDPALIITASGFMGFEPDIDIGAEFGVLSLKEFHAIANGQVRFDADIDVLGYYSLNYDVEKTLFSHTYPPILLGTFFGVPIIAMATIKLDVGADINSYIIGEASAGFESTAGVEVGFRYEKDAGWESVWNPYANYTSHPFTWGFDADLYCRIHAKPKIDIKLYGIAGPYLYGEPYVKADAEAHSLNDWNWAVTAGLDIVIGAHVEVLSRTLLDYNTNILGLEDTLTSGSSEDPSNPPYTPSTPSGPASGNTGTSYSFSSSASDPDGDNVRIIFSWGDGSADTSGFVASGVSENLSHIWALPNNYNIKCKAIDSHNEESDWSGNHSITITGTGNNPPNTPTVPSGATSGETGTSYSFSSSATDLDGDNVVIIMDWGDGTADTSGFVASGTSVELSHTWSSGSTCNVKAKAIDSHGAESGWSGNHSITITGTGNNSPNTPTVPSGATSGETGTSYSFSSSATDLDGDNVIIIMDWGDGAADTNSFVSSGTAVVLGHSWSSAATYNVKAKAIDTYNAESAWSTSTPIEITGIPINHPPDAPSTPTGPSMGDISDYHDFSTSATDPDGDNVVIIFDWGDGTADTSSAVASGAAVIMNHAWSPANDYDIKAKAIDTHDEESAWSSTATITIELVLLDHVASIGTPGQAYNVYVADNCAFIADNYAGLTTIDVSTPTTPVLASTLPIPAGYAKAVHVSSGYAYVAAEIEGLRVIDVSSPGSPLEVGHYDTDIRATDIFVEGENAYAIDVEYGFYVVDYGAIRIFDISSTSPSLISNIGYSCYYGDYLKHWRGLKAVFVTGGYAYIVNSFGECSEGLFKYSITTPSSPSLIDQGPWNYAICDVHVIVPYAYFLGGSGEVRIVDITVPGFGYRGSCDLSGELNGIFAVHNTLKNYAFVAAGSVGLRVIDVTDVDDPVEVAYYDTPGDAKCVFVDGHYAYVADYDNGLCIIDVSDYTD